MKVLVEKLAERHELTCNDILEVRRLPSRKLQLGPTEVRFNDEDSQENCL